MKKLTILCWFLIRAALGQEVVVQGTVANQYATPVPSARIEWKQIGTVAGPDSNGVFRISLSNIPGDELLASAYGYADTSIKQLFPASPLAITLHPMASRLQLDAAGIPKGMKPVTGGTFQMGMGIVSDQRPIHTVRVSSFWMDSTEVTSFDFDSVMKRYAWYTGLRPGIDAGAGMPLSRVSWYEAALYCNVRSKRDGLDTAYSFSSLSTGGGVVVLDSCVTHFDRKGYRLATEAEWEYACRGLAPTWFYWGNSGSSSTISRYAVYSGNSQSVQKTATKIPNAFGLYDLIGNVMERTNDRQGAYPDSVLLNPTGPQSGEWNEIRGYSWASSISSPPGGDRASAGLGQATYETGFRVVLRDTVRIPMLPDPHRVTFPDAPSFSTPCEAGNPVTFTQPRLALCTKAHPVAFCYKWGDGDTSPWQSGALHRHTYTDSGKYPVIVRARCTVDTTVVSDFSSPAGISVSGRHFVAPAPAMSGPQQGTAAVSHSFELQPSLCNKGHAVQYFYDWGDGFTSGYSGIKKTHSWSKGGTYAMKVFARCDWGIFSDTSRKTITIADTVFSPATNAFRSGFFSFSFPGGAVKPGIDFSDTGGKQYDVIFAGYGASGAIIVNVPFGAYDLGSMAIPNLGNSTTAKTLLAMDSLVSCRQIKAPENGFECCSTSTNLLSPSHPALIVKTAEGRYGLLVLYYYWMGGLDHVAYYWGYQSDGDRQFYPTAKCAASVLRQNGTGAAYSRMSVIVSRNLLTVSAPGTHPCVVISLYDLRGRIVKRKALSGLLQARLDLSDAPGGSYLIKVTLGNREFVRRLVRTN